LPAGPRARQLPDPGVERHLARADPGQDAAHPFGGKLSATTTPTLAAFTTAVNAWITVETAGN